jgi:hypothetical protein
MVFFNFASFNNRKKLCSDFLLSAARNEKGAKESSQH